MVKLLPIDEFRYFTPSPNFDELTKEEVFDRVKELYSNYLEINSVLVNPLNTDEVTTWLEFNIDELNIDQVSKDQLQDLHIRLSYITNHIGLEEMKEIIPEKSETEPATSVA